MNSCFCIHKISSFDIQSPPPEDENSQSPPNLGTLQLPEGIKLPEDLVTQITHPSEYGTTAPTSPINPNELGVPESPDQYAFCISYKAEYDQGNDSEGQPDPWEELEKSIWTSFLEYKKSFWWS